MCTAGTQVRIRDVYGMRREEPEALPSGVSGRQLVLRPVWQTRQTSHKIRHTHVGLGQVAVQGCGVELGEAVHLVDVGVEAVADGNVDQAVVCAQGHGWLGTLFGQGVQPGTRSTSQDDTQHSLLLTMWTVLGIKIRCPAGWTHALAIASAQREEATETHLGLEWEVQMPVRSAHSQWPVEGSGKKGEQVGKRSAVYPRQ
eukprot:616280-Pelagomonas_calceolata.AAC.3